MDSTTEVEAPTLHSWLSELATMFQERDDFRDEVERITGQYAETCEAMYNRGQELESLRKAHANMVIAYGDLQELANQRYHTIGELHERVRDLVRVDQTKTDLISELQKKLDAAHRIFGDSFVHGTTGAARKNRAKLTPAQVGGIRSMVRNGSQRAYVARVYGVHPTTVSRIANGTYHREVIT